MTKASSGSSLLPAARIAIFSPHAGTRDVVASLSQDWRFGRVIIEVHEGSAPQAIETYKHSKSPHLMMIDTDVIDETFTGALEQLAGVCAEGTDAIVIGPVNDISLYRYLISNGVSDYLVRPLDSVALADVIARILTKQLGASESQLIAFVGPKGGVGGSTLAQSFAYTLAHETKEKTVIMDMAGGHSYLPVAFGLEPTSTLAEASRAAAAQDPNVFNRTLLKVGDHLNVLGTGNDRLLEDPVPSEMVERLIDRLLNMYPQVIVDLSGAVPAHMRLVLSRAHHVFVVTLPTLSSLRPARGLIQDIQELRGGVPDGIHLVVNRVGEAVSAEIPKSDIESSMGISIQAMIPFDAKLVMGAEADTKILAVQKGAQKMIKPLLDCIRVQNTDDASKSSGLLSGLMPWGHK